MQKKLMLAAAAVMMLAACNGAKETLVSAQFGENAPELVKVTVGNKVDTTVVVKDGKFEVNVPVDLTTLSRVRFDRSIYSFISDGSKITLNLKDGEVAIRGWLEKSGVDFFSFCEKMAGIGMDMGQPSVQ